MNPLVPTVGKLLSLLTILGQVMVLIILISFFIYKKNKNKFYLLDILDKHALVFSFIIALVATLGSLFYSEIAGYEPCKLCWFQRIFMYPLVLLLGMAVWKNDNGISNYVIAMSTVGAFVAGYHYLLQIGAAPALVPCSTVGYSVSCVEKFVMNFGYITIPLMSLTAFLLIFLFLRPDRVSADTSKEE